MSFSYKKMIILNITRFLFYHSLHIPVYLLKSIKLGTELLEAGKAENEYFKKKAIADKTRNDIITTSNLLPFF